MIPMTKTNGLPILNRRAARRRYAGLLATALALPAGAQTVPLSGVPATLPAQLARLYPATHFGAIKATAWPGVFEIAMGANLAYVDATGQYFMFGHLYDMQGQTDLTAAHEDTAGRVDFSRLPLADALRDVRGNGQRVLALFSDPDCPYCRRLEIALKGLTDVTLYTFLTPLAALHPEAPAKAIAIWCAPDRLAACWCRFGARKPV